MSAYFWAYVMIFAVGLIGLALYRMDRQASKKAIEK